MKRAVLALVVLVISTAQAAASFTDDRLYLMGDDLAEDAAVGAAVGAGVLNFVPGKTLDSAGANDAGNYQDLTVVGNPVYVSAATRPQGAPDGMAISFSGDDYLLGQRMGFPQTSAPAVTGTPPIDYSGIANRGFQMWVKPNISGAGTTQTILADTTQHGPGISSSNTWTMTYNGSIVDSNVIVQFDQWVHMMVVRPFGDAGDQSGSQFYLNGEAIGLRAGTYAKTDDAPLSIGANATNPGNVANYFHGIVDDVSMFVVGTSLITSANYGSFNFLTDNAFAASVVSSVNGDITGDGAVDGADIAAFINGWLNRKVINGRLIGDLSTYAAGDLNLDGVTNLHDAVLLDNALRSFGLPVVFDASWSLSVPEPSVGVMAIPVALLVRAAKRRLNVRRAPLRTTSNDAYAAGEYSRRSDHAMLSCPPLQRPEAPSALTHPSTALWVAFLAILATGRLAAEEIKSQSEALREQAPFAESSEQNVSAPPPKDRPPIGPKLQSLQPMAPEEALASFQIHADFQLELVAAEPLIQDPIAMEFDEDGRAYVIELLPYNDYAKAAKGPRGRIKLLEDVNGDGKFDRSTIYCDDLNYPTGIFCYDGGLFVGDAPDLLYLKDSDGDGRADHRETLFSGFGTDPAGEGQLNSFRWGLDNRIHASTGLDGGEVRSASSPTEAPRSVRNRRFIFDPRTRTFELSSGGGQHGMSFDDWGRIFVCDNSDPAKTLLYDDRYLERNPWLEASSPAVSIAPDGKYTQVMRISAIDPWRVIRTTLRTEGKFAGSNEGGEASGFFTAGTGVTIYRGDAWLEEFKGSLLVGEAANNLVYRARLEKAGIGLVAHRADPSAEFLASTDSWFRPVQFAHGPDGALYVVDMYRELIEGAAFLPPVLLEQMDATAGMDRGRIYRIVPKSYRPRKLIAMSQLTSNELVPFLEDGNGWSRDTAARLLYQRQESEVVPAIRALAARSSSAVGRLHALYALDGLGALLESDVVNALSDSAPRVQEHAIRLAERFALNSVAVQNRLVSMANNVDALVRFQLSFSAGYLPTRQRDALLLALLKSDGQSLQFQLAIQSSLAECPMSMLRLAVKDEAFAGAAFAQRIVESLSIQVGTSQRPSDLNACIAFVDELVVDPDHGHQFARIIVKGLLKSRCESISDSFDQLSKGPGSDLLHEITKDSITTALDVDEAEELRIEAIKIQSAAGGFRDVRENVDELLRPHQSAGIQKAVLSELSHSDAPEIANFVIDRWAAFTPEVRESALEVILSRNEWTKLFLNAVSKGFIPRSDISANRVSLLQSHADVELQELAEAAFAQQPREDRSTIINEYQSSLQLSGDAGRGREIFRKSCAACHEIEGVGSTIGADLHAIRDRGRESVLLNILDPNREVKPQFQTFTVLTVEGRTFSGVITDESTNSVTLRQLDGSDIVIPRSDIEEFLGRGLSFMPEGLERDIDRQAMADLLEYLMSSN